jgi:hypothetical protein
MWSFAIDTRIWEWCTRLWLLNYLSEILHFLVFICVALYVKIDVVSQQLSFESSYMLTLSYHVL